LAEAGISAWAPHERRWRHIGRRKVDAGSALFPGYVFVLMKPEEPRFADVRAIDGVRGFVYASFNPATIEPRWIQLIQRAERVGLFDRTKTRHERRFAIGDAVRVKDGVDKGLLGQIIRGGTKERVRVLLTLFGRSMIATIETKRLEAA
jgi:transcription antitermination factor NusG